LALKIVIGGVIGWADRRDDDYAEKIFPRRDFIWVVIVLQ